MAPRKVVIALLQVPCLEPSCQAEIGEPCKNQHPIHVRKKEQRYHKERTELARRVGIEYVDTLKDIDQLPGLPGVAPG